MQLLYVANRYERKPDLDRWLEGGLILVCDRYVASSIAYGEAQGLDAGVAGRDAEVPSAGRPDHRPRHRTGDGRGAASPSIAIATSATSSLQARVRESYHRQASAEGWLVLDGERSKDAIAEDV